jgi:hypothetical protein
VGPLLEVGADDVEQLASLPEQDFQNLLEIIGMSKKLFHVLRFKKAINRSGNSSFITSANSSTHTVTVYATQLDDNTTAVTAASQLPSAGPQLYCSNNSDTPTTTTGVNFVSMMTSGPQPTSDAMIHRKSLSVTAHQLQNLVDDNVPIQKSLTSSPIAPNIWDEGRKEIIRKASQLFTNSPTSPLNEQEELMNEASYQLSLWDPTLLLRQKELYLLSRKLAQQFSPNLSSVELPEHREMRFDANTNGWSKIFPYTFNRGPDGKFRSCFEENYERRELQMQEIELLLAESSSKEKVKQAVLLEAKDKMDYSLALKIQEELSMLGKEQRELRSELSRLKKVQRRSLRHQELKKMKKDQPSSSTLSPLSYPILDAPSSPSQIHPATSNLAGIDNVPIQLHTYMATSTPPPTTTHTILEHTNESNNLLIISPPPKLSTDNTIKTEQVN